MKVFGLGLRKTEKAQKCPQLFYFHPKCMIGFRPKSCKQLFFVFLQVAASFVKNPDSFALFHITRLNNEKIAIFFRNPGKQASASGLIPVNRHCPSNNKARLK